MVTKKIVSDRKKKQKTDKIITKNWGDLEALKQIKIFIFEEMTKFKLIYYY